METVTYKNKGVDIAADIRFPPDFDASQKYPAIVCGHPVGSCKDQTSGVIYGARAPGYASVMLMV